MFLRHESRRKRGVTAQRPMRGLHTTKPVAVAAALLIGVLATVPAPAAATQDNPRPSPEEILARYLQRLEDRGGDLLLPKYTFEQATVVEQLGQNGETEEQETFRRIII